MLKKLFGRKIEEETVELMKVQDVMNRIYDEGKEIIDKQIINVTDKEGWVVKRLVKLTYRQILQTWNLLRPTTGLFFFAKITIALIERSDRYVDYY